MAEFKGKKVIFSPHIHFTGTDTSDATATADEIKHGKTAYVNGVKLTGTATLEDETYSELITETWGS